MADPDFSGEHEITSANALDNVRLLVDRLRHETNNLANLQSELERQQKVVDNMQLVAIPDAMAAAGLTELKLEDGAVLRVKPDVKVNISIANNESAMAWLRANGHGSIIRQDLTVDMRALEDSGRGVIDALDDLGAEYTTRETVHAATLKALVKDLLERGVTPPASISVFEFKKAELKEPKK